MKRNVVIMGLKKIMRKFGIIVSIEKKEDVLEEWATEEIPD